MKNDIEQLTRERDREFVRSSRKRTEKLINYMNVSEQNLSQSKAGAFVGLVGISVGIGLKYGSQVCDYISNYLSNQ